MKTQIWPVNRRCRIDIQNTKATYYDCWIFKKRLITMYSLVFSNLCFEFYFEFYWQWLTLFTYLWSICSLDDSCISNLFIYTHIVIIYVILPIGEQCSFSFSLFNSIPYHIKAEESHFSSMRRQWTQGKQDYILIKVKNLYHLREEGQLRHHLREEG